MTEPTRKLNIISLEELKGEIKNENKSSRGKDSSPVSEKFFIEKNNDGIEKNIKDNNNDNNDNIVGTHHGASEKNDNINIQKNPNLKNLFIEKKKINKPIKTKNPSIKKNEKIEFNKDLKQINKKDKTKNIVNKIGKEKNIEKTYINIQEASKISGISSNTIRKSLKSNELSYFFEKGKYSLELENFLKWIFQSTRRTNIINTKGMGKFIETWKI